MGKGGQDVFTESQPGSTRSEEVLFLLILPPPFGFLFWHCLGPKKGWEFGKWKYIILFTYPFFYQMLL